LIPWGQFAPAPLPVAQSTALVPSYRGNTYKSNFENAEKLGCITNKVKQQAIKLIPKILHN